MIPGNTAFLEQDFEFEEQPAKTYKMDLESNLIRGYTDGLDAMKQAIYKILSTERYQYTIYSENYGVELLDLCGEPASYVCPELERRISEALTADERIESVTDFEFDLSEKGVVHVSFTAYTVFGDVQVEREVNF